jgi:hypothetical protein
MWFEKKAIGAVCVACGASLAWNGAHPGIECRPRIELCAPTAIYMPDMPHKEPAPTRGGVLSTIIGSTVTAASLSLWPNLPPTKL